MALTPSFPVLVLMKSLPAIMHTKEAFEWFVDQLVLHVNIFGEGNLDVKSYADSDHSTRFFNC